MQMTKYFKCLLSAFLLVSITLLFVTFASAESQVKVEEHSLTFSLPNNYVLLNADTAKDNEDLIESLGYSVSSFKNYLKPADKNSPQTLFLGVMPNTKSQILVKSWSTEFSKKINDFSYLNDSSLFKTAKELITTNDASFKIVSANGMKFVEIRTNAKDSGGDFCSVQYITVRNGKFYSLNFTFSGSINDQNVQSAWDALITLKIKSSLDKSVWDAGSITILVLLFAVIIIGIIVAGIIVYSIITDIKKRRLDINEDSDYISRRK